MKMMKSLRKRVFAGARIVRMGALALDIMLLFNELLRFYRLIRRHPMPRGDKSAYTSKQKRQAEHIEEGYERRGVGAKTAKARAWATVNKMTGGGKKSGSGRGHRTNTSSARKGGRKGGRSRATSRSR
jgi:plasmid stabilization system protein ParE